MSEKLPDRRLEKTRNALAHALFTLLQKHAWEDIGIAMLCEQANVARSSYYAHFPAKMDLLDYIISREIPDGRDIGPHHGDSPIRLIAWFIDHATQNRALFQRVAVSPEARPVMTRFRMVLSQRLRTDLAYQERRVSDMALAFLLGGVFESVLDWARTWQISRISALKSDTLLFAEAVLAADVAMGEN